MIPLAVLLAGMQVVAERDPFLAPAGRLVTFLLSALGLVTVVFALGSAVGDLGGLMTWVHFEQFVMPLALTAAFVPFLYYVALWSTYEQVFTRIDTYGRDDGNLRRAKWAMVRVCRLNLRKVGRFSRRFFLMIQSVSPDATTGTMIRTFESQLRRLARFADLDDQVETCRRVFASDTRWTVVRGSDLEEGESEGLPVWSRHVGDPILESNLTRRVDFALFMVDALRNDELIHEAPGRAGPKPRLSHSGS